MRIGIDARFFGPASKGLGRYTQKLIMHLEKIDHENEYVIFLREENFDLYEPINKNFKKVITNYQWYSFGEQLFFPFILYKHKCDLVHFPHFNVPLLYFRKFIVTIHDLILLRYPTHKASTRNKFFYWFKFLMYRLVIFFALYRAKNIIAVSKFTKKDICKEYRSVCKKVSVIYEAANIKNKKITNAQEVLQKYGIMNSYMLYVGNAYPHKNLLKLVDAFTKYRSKKGNVAQLVLVGCDDYFYMQLEKYIQKQKLQNIKIFHTISDQLLQTLYKKASFFVFPSLYEGFGLPPLEAQLLGVPVLSSDRSCMKEILSENGALYSSVTDVDMFAQAMCRISKDHLLQKDLVQNGYKNAKKYSWHKMTEQTHTLYMEQK